MRHIRNTVLVGVAMFVLFGATAPLADGNGRVSSGCPDCSQAPHLYRPDPQLQGWVGGQRRPHRRTNPLQNEFFEKLQTHRVINHPPPGVVQHGIAGCESDAPLVSPPAGDREK